MSQETSPEGNPPGYESPDPGLPIVADIGKGDPAVRAERMPGIIVGGVGTQFGIWVLIFIVVVGLVILFFQTRH